MVNHALGTLVLLGAALAPGCGSFQDPNVAVDLRLYNLLDKNYAVTTYSDEQWILGRPRSVDVSLRARF